MNKFLGLTVIGVVLSAIVAFLVVVSLQTFFTMLLWNWIMPVLFSLPHVSFLQAFGILALLNMISSAFRPRVVKE